MKHIYRLNLLTLQELNFKLIPELYKSGGKVKQILLFALVG